MHEANHGQLPASFFDLVRTSEKPVLVDFWAEWCGPCRLVSPAIERLAVEYSGLLLTVKVNVDRRPLIAQAFQVQGIPTIMLFWKGEPRMRLTGAYPYEAIKKNLQENWPRDAEAEAGGASEAGGAREAGEEAQARPESTGTTVT